MALISKPKTFAANSVIVSADVNSDFDTIYNDYNGNITGANISDAAAIPDSKLATITTGAKVNISALTADSQAAGDILYASSASSYSRLAKGTQGQTLIMGASLPEWGSPGIVGEIKMWSGTIATVPTGYLFCNGAAISQSTYAALYAVIGHQYAADPGSGNFKLPDLRNYYLVGANADGSGIAGVTAALSSANKTDGSGTTVASKTRQNNNYINGNQQSNTDGPGGPHPYTTTFNGASLMSANAVVAYPDYVAVTFIIKY